jgi:hypothetical protein
MDQLRWSDAAGTDAAGELASASLNALSIAKGARFVAGPTIQIQQAQA